MSPESVCRKIPGAFQSALGLEGWQDFQDNNCRQMVHREQIKGSRSSPGD